MAKIHKLNDLPRGKRNDYDAVKAAIVAQGYCTVWDFMQSTRRAKIGDRLFRDPRLKITRGHYPYFTVERAGIDPG